MKATCQVSSCTCRKDGYGPSKGDFYLNLLIYRIRVIEKCHVTEGGEACPEAEISEDSLVLEINFIKMKFCSWYEDSQCEWYIIKAHVSL